VIILSNILFVIHNRDETIVINKRIFTIALLKLIVQIRQQHVKNEVIITVCCKFLAILQLNSVRNLVQMPVDYLWND
jgi:hypothetical protein